MRLARRGVLLVALLAVAGCGGKSHPQRDAVNAYFDKVDRAEAGLVASSGEIDRAFRNFKLSGSGAQEVRELTFARDRVAAALAKVQALHPPADARALHADIVRLLTLQRAAAAELLGVVVYQPRFERAIAPLAGAGKALAADIRQAAKTKAPPAKITSADRKGAGVFVGAGCGTCHTLSATSSTGTAGPNLDVLQLSAAQVAAQVRSGGGGMPAFAKKLKPADIDLVAAFISSAEAHAAASNAVLDAYAAAFSRYHEALQGILASLEPLDAPAVLEPTFQAELLTLGRASRLSGRVGSALTSRDVVVANQAIRQLFATAAAASSAETHKAVVAAVGAYNARLRRIALLSARIVRERQALVASVG